MDWPNLWLCYLLLHYYTSAPSELAAADSETPQDLENGIRFQHIAIAYGDPASARDQMINNFSNPGPVCPPKGGTHIRF